jgi:hypothetical protein
MTKRKDKHKDKPAGNVEEIEGFLKQNKLKKQRKKKKKSFALNSAIVSSDNFALILQKGFGDKPTLLL